MPITSAASSTLSRLRELVTAVLLSRCRLRNSCHRARRWTGPVITGWGAMARTEEETHKVVQDLIDSQAS
jgi:hypothetical protein